MRRALIALLGIGVGLLAGCTSLAPATSPTVISSDAPPPSAPAAAPAPSPCLGQYRSQPIIGASLERTDPFLATIRLAPTWIDPRPSGSAWSVEPLPETVSAIDADGMTVYIGGSTTFDLAIEADTAWVPRITQVWIGVGPDSAHLADTRARVNASRIEADFPDVDAVMVLEAVVDFTDGCVAIEARALQQVRIVRAAVAAACPSGDVLSSTLALGERGLTTPDGLRLRYRVTEGIPRFSGGAWSVDGPPLSAWSPAEPSVGARAGSTLRFTIRPPDLLLANVAATYYRRADVMADPQEISIKPVARSTPTTAADGSLVIRLPDKPGRYVLLLSSSYALPCVVGQGFVVTSVDLD